MKDNKNAYWSSSESVEWYTPQHIFDDLDREFHFTLDPCATPENAKCTRFFTKDDDGLLQDWSGETVFMNPPYGRTIGQWIRKAHDSAMQGSIVVCLIPARTDTSAWHDYIFGRAEIRFLRGRLKFGGATLNAPFPSAIVIFGTGNISVSTALSPTKEQTPPEQGVKESLTPVEKPCPKCGGSGELESDITRNMYPCPTCHGTGRVKEKQ